MSRYLYGMRLRLAAPGAQPKEGLVEIIHGEFEDSGRKYWDALVYDRELSAEERRAYDLDLILVAKDREV